MAQSGNGGCFGFGAESYEASAGLLRGTGLGPLLVPFFMGLEVSSCGEWNGRFGMVSYDSDF